MQINDKLYQLFNDRAQTVRVERVCLGLGYTAVKTSDGGVGLSYTYLDNKKRCVALPTYTDYENQSAVQLLDCIHSDKPIERTMALALINALNYSQAIELPEDPNNSVLLDHLKINPGCRVAMAGFFGPMMSIFKDRQADVEVFDLSRQIGNRDRFYEKLHGWAEVLLLTATALLNNTAEELLAQVNDTVRTVVLGPSTPMVPMAFDHLPVHLLAGSTPVQKESVLKAVRHGLGTRALHRYCRRVVAFR